VTAQQTATPTTAAPNAPGKVWFPALDGLRATAALLVMVFHVSGSVAYFVEPLKRLPGDTRGIWTAAGVLARFGNWGVAIFFVLSGFLLYRPFADAWLAGRPTGSLRSYFSRRLLRIVPAYWVALTVYLFVIRHGAAPLGGRGSYWLFYLFAQNYKTGYVDRGGGLAVAWTLCIEMSFYIVLPLLALALRSVSPTRWTVSRRAWAQVGAIAGVSLATVWLRWWVIQAHPLQTFWLPAHFAWFGLGMIAAVLHAGGRAGVRVPALARLLGTYPELSWLFGIQVFWLTTLITVRPWVQTREELMLIFVGNGISAALLLAPLVFGDQARGPLRRALSGVPMKWLGEVSYGIYLWHTIVLVEVVYWVDHRTVPSSFLPRIGLVLVITLVISAASLYLLERPIMTLVQKPRAVRRPPAAAPPSAPAGGNG